MPGPTLPTYRRASAAEDRREVEPAEALGVGEDVDLDDLPARYREAHDRPRHSPRGRYGPRGPVHERRLGEGGQPRVGECLTSPGRD
jgi:hypothetical protein